MRVSLLCHSGQNAGEGLVTGLVSLGLCWDKGDDPKEQKTMGTMLPNNLGHR